MSNSAVHWLSPSAAMVCPLLGPCLASLVLHLPGMSIVLKDVLLLGALTTRIHLSASVPSPLLWRRVTEWESVGPMSSSAGGSSLTVRPGWYSIPLFGIQFLLTGKMSICSVMSILMCCGY